MLLKNKDARSFQRDQAEVDCPVVGLIVYGPGQAVDCYDGYGDFV